MQKPLHLIQDKPVEKVAVIHDYTQFFFEGGWTLNIYNPYKFTSKNLTDIKKLNGLDVIGIDENDQFAELRFSDGSLISIRLDNGAYTGPEAMSLQGPNGEVYAWN